MRLADLFFSVMKLKLYEFCLLKFIHVYRLDLIDRIDYVTVSMNYKQISPPCRWVHISLCVSTSHLLHFPLLLYLWLVRMFFPLVLLLSSLIFPLDNTKENRSIPHSLYHQRENILPPYSFWYFPCNVIIRCNASQQNNYFLFATTSLINAIFIYNA